MVHSSKKLPCGHIFHTACLRSWFQRQQTCPTCRLNILRTTSRPATVNNQNEQNANPPNPVLPDANPAQGIQNNMPPGNLKKIRYTDDTRDIFVGRYAIKLTLC